MYSSRRRGRSARSSASSCVPAGTGATIRVSVSFSIAIVGGRHSHARHILPSSVVQAGGSQSIVLSWLRKLLQCLLDSIGNGDTLRKVLHGARCLALAVTERDQRVHDVR